MKHLFIILTIIGISFSQICYAEDFLPIGEEIQKEKTETSWMLRSFSGGYDLRPPGMFDEEKFDNFMYGSEILYEILDTENSELYFGISSILVGSRYTSAPGMGLALRYRYRVYKGLYLQPGCSIMYMANPDDLPALDKANPFGGVSIELGIEITDNVSIGYSIEHISSLPSMSDCGQNVGAIVFSVKF